MARPSPLRESLGWKRDPAHHHGRDGVRRSFQAKHDTRALPTRTHSATAEGFRSVHWRPRLSENFLIRDEIECSLPRVCSLTSVSLIRRLPRQLRDLGFTGLLPVSSLCRDRCAAIPERPGVYLVLRERRSSVRFLAESPAYHFKGKNPTLAVDELRKRWVPATSVVYIGKAGRLGAKSTLQSRVKCFLEFGRGRSCAHWGGRATWQLVGSDKLLVAWKTTTAAAARPTEKKLIEEHVAKFGSRPFANRTG